MSGDNRKKSLKAPRNVLLNSNYSESHVSWAEDRRRGKNGEVNGHVRTCFHFILQHFFSLSVVRLCVFFWGWYRRHKCLAFMYDVCALYVDLVI